MAEFAVSPVVENLKNLLSQQAAYLGRVSQKIMHIRNELRWMRSFLKDANMKQEENDLMHATMMSYIRDVAYETEEVIETYVSRAAAQSITKPFYPMISEDEIYLTRNHHVRCECAQQR
ncbi:hypothetical protein V6N11_040310 [Hibiscus sabdariffa]